MEGQKISRRDETLVRVLERLANQVEQLGLRMEEAEKRQIELFMAVERTEPRQNETNASLAELNRAFVRYRSDMVGLVSGQDSVDKDMKALINRQEALANRQAAMVNAQEIISQDLAGLNGQFGVQEKTAREHLAFSIRHGETFSAEMEALGRHNAKLHMDTEKHLAEAHRETQRRLDELRLETTRRLLALDWIEEGLRELLRRTEPPKPKDPNWVIRQFLSLRDFTRSKMTILRNGWKRKNLRPANKNIRHGKPKKGADEEEK